MLRIVSVLFALMIGFSGCFSSYVNEEDLIFFKATSDCYVRLYLDGSNEALLTRQAPQAGSRAGNGFSEGFLTNDMEEWRTNGGLEHICPGNNWLVRHAITLEYSVESTVAPAPILSTTEPGSGYHFFNQIGDVTGGFLESYAIEYEAAASTPGTIRRFQERFMPDEGGWLIESGSPIRLLLTSLVLDGGPVGNAILYGGNSPSFIDFVATPVMLNDIRATNPETHNILLPANQGLLTGQIPPADGLNRASISFELRRETNVLELILRDESPGPFKGDADISIIDITGNQIYSIGSPYSFENKKIYQPNLDEKMPPGRYEIRVEGYSTVGFVGTLHIRQHSVQNVPGWDFVLG